MKTAVPLSHTPRRTFNSTMPRFGVGTVADAVRVLTGMRTPQRLVIDLSGSVEPFADVEALANVCDDGTQLVALGDVNDVNLYRDLMICGASDYLVKPITASAIAAALQRPDREALRSEVTTCALDGT